MVFPDRTAQIHILRHPLLLFIFRDHHGFHAVDLFQFLLGFLQLQLQLFHCQTLALQLQVGQCGVKGHEQVTLVHRISRLHQDFRHRLGVRQKHRLDLIGSHRAMTFLGVAPVFRHADKLEGIHVHRLRIVMPHVIPDAAACRHGNHRCHSGEEPFLSCLWALFSVKSHGHPPLRRPLSGVLRPEYGRSCRHTRQWHFHG